MASILLILTILIPWLGALLVWAVGDRHPRAQHGLAVAFSLAAGLAALILIGFSSSKPVINLPVGGVFGNFSFAADGLGVLLAAIATVIGSLAVIFSVDYMRGEAQLGRYYSFVLFFIGAMVGLVLTTSLLLMFVFWEITALCSYALIAFHNDDPKAVAGGMKALIITQLGGVGLLAGALLLFVYQGNYDIPTFLLNAGAMPAGVLAAMAFGCLAAAAAKSAQFPFQTWLPDAMEAPTPISALIHAATMVNAGVYLLARFHPAFAQVPGWRVAVVAVGLLSALLAAVMALLANDLKRVLAYSTVSQLGFMVYAIGAGSVMASAFHLFSHSIFKALLFLAAGSVIHAAGTRDMRQMGGLGQHMPFVRNVFIIGALALAGLPVLNGFWSKEFILEVGLEQGPLWGWLGMLLVAGLTALYTLRATWLVFFGTPRSHLHAHDAGKAMKTALAPLALGALVSWVAAGPFFHLLVETLPAHHLEAETTAELAITILKAPVTWLAMAVVGLGLATWVFRMRLGGVVKVFTFLAQAGRQSFGFEAINRGIVSGTYRAAEWLRGSQTGALNWNVFGILAGLAVVLAIVLGVC